MQTEPEIVQRSEQPYVAIKESVALEMFDAILPPLLLEVFAWLEARGVRPVGSPFWKYNVIDMEHGMVVEVGVRWRYDGADYTGHAERPPA